MKNYIIGLFMGIGMLISLNSQAHINSVSDKEKAAIEKTLKTYFGEMENANWAASLDYIHPGLFEIVEKELILQSLDQLVTDPTMRTSFSNMEIMNVSDVVGLDSGRYATVKYSFILSLQILDVESDSTDRDDYADMMLGMFQMQYGEDNVAFDSLAFRFDITSFNTLYAINAPSLNGWKFIENKENLAFIIESIVPAVVREELSQ